MTAPIRRSTSTSRSSDLGGALTAPAFYVDVTRVRTASISNSGGCDSSCPPDRPPLRSGTSRGRHDNDGTDLAQAMPHTHRHSRRQRCVTGCLEHFVRRRAYAQRAIFTHVRAWQPELGVSLNFAISRIVVHSAARVPGADVGCDAPLSCGVDYIPYHRRRLHPGGEWREHANPPHRRRTHSQQHRDPLRLQLRRMAYGATHAVRITTSSQDASASAA